MPEQGRQGADNEDHRQHPESKDEHRPGIGRGVGLPFPAGEEAEDEGDAGLGGRSQTFHGVSRSGQNRPGRGQAEQHQDQEDLQGDHAQGQAQGEGRPPLRQGPADPEHGDDAQQALRVFQPEHHSSPPTAAVPVRMGLRPIDYD